MGEECEEEDQRGGVCSEECGVNQRQRQSMCREGVEQREKNFPRATLEQPREG